MKFAFKNAQSLFWVYLKCLVVCCYSVSQILSTLPGYHYTLRGEGEADAISVSSRRSREYSHHTGKGKRREADHLFQSKDQVTRQRQRYRRKKGHSHKYILIFPFQVWEEERVSCSAPCLGLGHMTAVCGNPTHPSVVRREEYRTKMENSQFYILVSNMASGWCGL